MKHAVSLRVIWGRAIFDRTRFPACHGLFPTKHRDPVDVFRRFHRDDRVGIGCCTGRKQPLGQGCRGDNGEFGPAVAQDMLVQRLRIGGVGRHRDATRRHDRQIGHHPVWPVFGNQNDTIALFHTQLCQPGRQLAHFISHACPTLGPVGAIVFRPQECTVAMLACLIKEHGGQIWPVVIGHGSPPAACPITR